MTWKRKPLPKIGNISPDQADAMSAYLKDQFKPKKRKRAQMLSQLEKKGRVR